VVHVGVHDYRQKFGWYMERAARGENLVITRRGRPYARLTGVAPQLELAAEAA
jgi:prevent-host-death family protein